MSKSYERKKSHLDYYIFFLILILIILTSFYSYLLFHTLAELFSIVIKITIFSILWNSKEHLDNSFFLVVGLSFIFIGFIDLLHTLAYTGMNIFIGYGTNLPSQLWIAARYLQAISFLIASLVLRKKVNEYYFLIGFSLYTGLIITFIFVGIFPVCYIDPNLGLTPFKIISEYVIDTVFIITIYILYRKRSTFDKNIFFLIISSMIITIASELSFTLYTTAVGIPNLIGHIFKIMAFFLLYKAIISIGLKNPIDLLYRKLKLSEEKYRLFVESAHEGIWVIDKNAYTTYVNKRMMEILGYSEQEMIGKHLFVFMDKENIERSKYYLKRREEGIKEQHDFEFLHKNGNQVYTRLETAPFLDEKQEYDGAIAFISDITEKKKAEEALKKSESELKEIVKEITCLYRISGFASSFNKEESDLFKEILEILPSAFQFPEKTYARIVFDGQEFTSKNFKFSDWNIKADIKVHDKKLGSVEIFLHNNIPKSNEKPFLKEEEDLNRAIAEIISRFIEHKKAEQKLEQFVSTVSHELRNPIAVLMMSLNYLNKYKENITDEQKGSLMRGIMRNVNLLNELVNDLLTLSRIEEKKMVLDWKIYSPLEIVSEVLDLMEPNFRSKDIIIELDIKKDLKLMGDVNNVKQIFRIFIDNACKYSEKESKISIQAIDHYFGKFNPERKDGILFQIIDSGMGIHEEDIPFIFDRFYRANSVKDIPGTGLGLTIAKELIQLHQGKVYVESEFGNGTTFSIFFPKIQI